MQKRKNSVPDYDANGSLDAEVTDRPYVCKRCDCYNDGPDFACCPNCDLGRPPTFRCAGCKLGVYTGGLPCCPRCGK
jgi:hypothetical protein